MKNQYRLWCAHVLGVVLLCVGSQALGQWSAGNLSVARNILAATSAGGKVFFAAGAASSGVSNVVDIYDTATNQWSSTTLSQARYQLAATSAGGKVFFAGGSTIFSYSNVVDIYDTATNQWSTATLSVARSQLAATSVGSKVFFAGGRDTSNEQSNAVDIYDTATNQWTTATLSVARNSLAATSAGGKVFFGGGFDGRFYSNVVDIYDTATGQWSAATLSVARYELAATSAGDKVFFGGGSNGSLYSNAVDIYDTATNQWTTANLSVARNSLAATSAGGKVFFGGGNTGGSGPSVYSSVVDIYDTATNQWSATTLSQARHSLVATSAGGKAFFGGGVANGNVPSSNVISSVVDIYDTGVDQWTTASLSQGRFPLAATSVGSKVLFGGGTVGGGGYSNVVDMYDTGGGIWTTANLSVARAQLAAISAGSKAFFAGGSVTPSQPSSVVDIYDTGGGWTTATLSQGRFELAATSAGGKAFFAGGRTSSNDVSNVVDIYDTATNQWTTDELSQARGQLAAASAGGKVFFAGGLTSSGGVYSDVVDIYDTGTGNWTTATLSQARTALVATSAGGKVFFAGGFTGSDISNVVDIYDTATNQWTTANLSQGRFFLAATSAGGKAFFGGGLANGSVTSRVVDIYDTATGQWTTDKLSVARYGLAATSAGSKAFFGGGLATGAVYSDVVDIYDTAPSTPPTPTVVTQEPTPSSQSVCQGSPASTTLTATGTGLTYQWYRNQPDTDEPVSNQTAPTLNLTNLLPTDGGTYYCRVSGDGGVVWSAAFTLTVHPAATASAITASSATVCAGGTVTYSATVGGGATGGSFSDGGVGGSFTTPSVVGTLVTATYQPPLTYAGAVTITFTTTDPDGPCLPDTTTTPLTVNPLPVLSQVGAGPNPVCEGSLLSLSATASGGTGTLSYAWSGPNSFSASTNPASRTVGNSDGGVYSVVVSDQNNCQTSGQTASVSVSPPPTSLPAPTLPAGLVVCAGQTLSVGVASAECASGLTAQLSDKAGDFTTPTATWSVVGGSNSLTLPLGLPSGTAYRVRLVSTAPSLTSTVSEALTVTAIGVGQVSTPLKICQRSDALPVTFSTGGSCSYPQGNTFTVQLSSATSSFANPTVLGVATPGTTTFPASLLAGLSAGTGYRVRIVSSSPATTSSASVPFRIEGPNLNLTPSVGGAPVCRGSEITVSFTLASCPFPNGNVFTAQLSSAAGSFNNPTTLAPTLTPGQPTQVTIPASVAAGTGYRIRIVSNSPVLTSANSSAFQVKVCTSRLAAEEPDLVVSPNPISGGEIRLRVTGMDNPAFSLTTPTGRDVGLSVKTDPESSGGEFVLTPKQGLTPGLYAVQATEGSTRLTRRVLVTD